ncbi:hypothetical protein MMC10_011239 [Thelotrema lepadinum]|nr:hypothetical protein [Thelotrema lepadinum]
MAGICAATVKDQAAMQLDDSAFPATENTPVLDVDTVVIVGGGSLGLSTAYNLALEAQASQQMRRVIVVEIQDHTFGAASGQNTGCLHHEFREKEGHILEPLGKYSFDLWQDIAKKDGFRAAVGYRAHNFFEVNPGSGQGLDELPDWFSPDTSWDTDQRVLASPSAMVNPIGIGKWLTSECIRLGVEIRLGTAAVSATLSQDNEIRSVEVVTNSTRSLLGCSSLVLAAGPWTPDLYQAMFPYSRIKLEGVPIGGDWILFKNPYPVTEKSNAFVALDGIIGEKLEFTGRDDGTIWLIGRKDNNAALPAPGANASASDVMIEELKGRAERYLRSTPSEMGKGFIKIYPLLSTGRGIRPGRQSLLPIISEVPTAHISNLSSSASSTGSDSSGVFINWGHGSYGLTLGMGSGKLLSEMINKQKHSINPTPFLLRPGSN